MCEITDMCQITNAVLEKIKKRAEEGLKKYGTTMQQAELTPEQWLVHAQEESLDHAIYVEKLIQMYKNKAN